MKAINKIAQLADYFEVKLAAEPMDSEMNPSPEQLQERLTKANLELSIDSIKKELMDFLSLSNPDDINLRLEYLPMSKKIRASVSFRKNIEQQVNSRVAANKKTEPSFQLGNFIKSLSERYNKNIPTDVQLLPSF